MASFIKFQFARAFESKKLVLSIALLIIIAVSGFALCEVFYSSLDDSRLGLLSLFNSFTQFFYLVFAYILVSLFADDIQVGSDILFRYMGYNKSKVVFGKLLYSIVLLIPFTDIVILLGVIFYGCSDIEFVVNLLLLLDLSIIQVILIACALSLLIRKTNIATIVMYGCFMCFNILNLFTYGLTNQADGNSITTYFVTISSGITKEQPFWSSIIDFSSEQVFLLSIAANLIWIFVLLLIVLFKLKRNKK